MLNLAENLQDKELAKQIITDIHGESEYLHAKEVSECLFTGKVANLTDKEIATVFKGVPTFADQNIPLIELLVENKSTSSKREAREFLKANAITVNGEVIQDENYILEDKKYNIIRRGKKKYFLIEKDL